MVDLGVLPTPGGRVAVGRSARCPAAMVSASHNPFTDNGIKLFAAGGLKLPDAVEATIEDELDKVLAASDGPPSPPSGPRRGPAVVGARGGRRAT